MHLLRQYRRALEEFLTRNSGPLLLLAALFVIGIIFGALAVRSLAPHDKQELVAYLRDTTGALNHPVAGSGGFMLQRALLGNAKLLALLWVLGISVIGVVGVMLTTLFRGFYTGFAVAYLAAELGPRGIALAAAGHLPQSLLEVPAILLAGTASVAFSSQVIRSWRERRRVPQFYSALGRYTITLLTMGLLLLAASAVESFISPALVRLVVTYMQP